MVCNDESSIPCAIVMTDSGTNFLHLHTSVLVSVDAFRSRSAVGVRSSITNRFVDCDGKLRISAQQQISKRFCR